jgi:tryptophanyl-tRNA synthetase
MINAKTNKKRILSGIQPSGKLHLGNYFGMMKRMIDYQDNHDLFCFIANYHALTSNPNKDILSKNTFEAVCDFLALGIDAEKSTFWVQSDVPQVTELSWILSSLTSVSLMDRSTSYKDKILQGLSPNMALYSYPILMCSDILLFDSDIVPVGKDQKQHLEITREIAKKVNNKYGQVLVVPEPEMDVKNQLVPGIDGRKMSKSYKNIIPIFDESKTLRKSIMKIVTDLTEINSPKDKNTTLFKIYCLFINNNEKNKLIKRYDSKGLRYGDVKLELYEKIMDYFKPYRDKRDYYLSNPNKVKEILKHGSEKAKIIAIEVLDRIRSATGISYKA